MTSVFIHVSPMLLSHALRWSEAARAEFGVCGVGVDCGAVPAWTLWSRALARFYLPWVVGYYVGVFVLMGDYLKRRSYQTLFDRVVSKGPAAKALRVGFAATGASHELAQRAVYMMVHLLFGALSTGLAVLHWHSFAAHTAFVLAICAASAWNGATYYFTFFSAHYEEGVQKAVRRAAE